MLKLIALVIVVVIAAILIYAATLPDEFHVERSASIQAAPEKIFPLINDLHQWEAWTPYNKDPNMKKTYSGAANGVGASYAWDGNGQVGQGSVTITESVPVNRIVITLDIVKPFPGQNKVVFTLIQNGSATRVTWAMAGKSPYFAKIFGLIFNMEKMVTGDFDIGLANLKKLAEK
jgi:uncharacterized protein YndB with AHSA1/START domain